MKPYYPSVFLYRTNPTCLGPIGGGAVSLPKSFICSGVEQREHHGLCLKPETDEIHKRNGGPEKPYRIVGALARPSKTIGGFAFVNVQKDFQLEKQSDKGVIITVDAT